MKLAYKLGGLFLGAGASVATYLLIPSSSAPVEKIEKPKVLIKNNVGAWQKGFTDKGYVPLSIEDKTVNFQGLFDAFKKSKEVGLEKDAGTELVKLCDSFKEKEALNFNEEKEAERWCFKPRKMEDILISRGKKPIFKLEGEEAHEDWNKDKLRELAREYMQTQDQSLKMESAWDDPTLLVVNLDDLDGNLEKFKNACVNAFKPMSYDDEIEQKINRAEKWCTEVANS